MTLVPIPTPLPLPTYLSTYPHMPNCDYFNIMDLLIIYTHKLKTIQPI